MDLNSKLAQANLKCKFNNIDLNFLEIYPFTTESISGYISKFDLKNKSLLTVGSSGDQVINAVLFNCKDIDVIDVCPFTKYYFYLKKAALMTLNYDEFLSFFCYKNFSLLGDNSKAFNMKLFNKLSDVLKEFDYESYLFWVNIFKINRSIRIRRNLFSKDEDSKYILKKTNPYLENSEVYKKTRILIKDVNPSFYLNDISKIKLNKKYDNIWLSNIGQYMALSKLKKIVDKLNLNLNEEGKILLCYLYRFVKETEYAEEWSKIYDLKSVLKTFKDYNISIDSFFGVSDYEKDSILVYKKIRK